MSGGIRVHLRIHGRVQGVFFRQSTKEAADRLGLRGFVRNLDDGDVEAVGEGPPAAVEEWVSFCHRGPAQARVDRVDRTDAPPQGDFTSFEVRP